VIDEIEDIIGIDATDTQSRDAKNGVGIDTSWRPIAKVPPPKGDPGAPLSALIIDSWFDNYVGVVMLVRVMNGTLKPKDKILLMVQGSTYNCEQVGVFTPKSVARDSLSAGDVGFIIAGIKEIDAAKVGDTVTLAARPAAPLPGHEGSRSIAGSIRGVNQPALRDALNKLKERCVAALRAGGSQALGFGFRLGSAPWISQERLEREHDILITTAPTVVYQVLMRRHAARDRESVEAARLVLCRGNPRADHHGDDPDAAGIRRARDHPVHGEAGRAEKYAVFADR
jgi:GTP-binding protein LepA